MNSEKEDLRSKRTKKHLRNALCDLMYTRQINEISIKELAEKAEISRCTFYLYYDNIYDMIDSIQNELLEKFKRGVEEILNKNISENEMLLEIIRFSFKNTADNLPFSKLFYAQENQSYINRFAEFVLSEADLQSRTSSFKDKKTLRFITYGMLSLISDWIINDMPNSIEEMSALINSIVIGAASSAGKPQAG